MRNASRVLVGWMGLVVLALAVVGCESTSGGQGGNPGGDTQQGTEIIDETGGEAAVDKDATADQAGPDELAGEALPGEDTQVVPDASPDSTTDPDSVTVPDSVPDTAPDAVPDSVPDSVPDTTPDTTVPDTTPDAKPETDTAASDPLCPAGQQCLDLGQGYSLCLANGNVPADAVKQCHASDTGCAGNTACLYTNDQQTTSACLRNCGECPGGTTCGDVTGDGYLGCLVQGSIPAGAPTGCHASDTGCAGNATCFYTNSELTESVCIDNCSGCFKDADCGAGNVCVGGLCQEAPCTADDQCGADENCVEGTCIPDLGNGPGPGPGPACPDLPPATCSGTAAYCGELIPFDPDYGEGYIDYPENGETWQNQYRSFLRRDAVMAIQYAAALVACKLGDFPFGNGGPVGLIDMSEANGAIPGTSIGSPGHPEGTHTNGFDIDLAYYQVGTGDNRARPVCEHTENGAEAYHCTQVPDKLDPWRTALFMGALFGHPNLRVIGCDGKVGPFVVAALEYFCDNGWLGSAACANVALAYEPTNQGWGWFYFHHHHFHVSFEAGSYGAPLAGGVAPERQGLVPGGDQRPVERFLRARGLTPASRLVPVKERAR
jgi:hypothetical protein